MNNDERIADLKAKYDLVKYDVYNQAVEKAKEERYGKRVTFDFGGYNKKPENTEPDLGCKIL